MLRNVCRNSKTFIVLQIVLITVFVLFYDCRFSGTYIALPTSESLSILPDNNNVSFYTGEFSSFLSRLDGPLLAEDPQLVSYVYSNFLKPPSNLPYRFSIPKSENPFIRKPNKLHQFVFNTFKDIDRPGFFIEAGAVDGIHISNTLWLEYKKNWTGLLIEPDEANCKTLESRHRRAWTSCSCVSPQKYAMKSVFEIPHGKNYWFFKSNVRSINSRLHTLQVAISRSVNQSKGTFTYSTFQCFPLITYLLALNVSEVDLLSLDTQGGEKSMMMNFPFDKVRVNYMLIEYYKRGPSPTTKDDELVSYLNSKGFDLITMFNNRGEYIFKLR